MPPSTPNAEAAGPPQAPVQTPVPVPIIPNSRPPPARGASPAAAHAAAAPARPPHARFQARHIQPPPVTAPASSAQPATAPAQTHTTALPPAASAQPYAATARPTALTAQASATAAPPAQRPERSSSPSRPPVSPITPPLNPLQSPPARNTYAHSSHPEKVATMRPPPPESIEFDTNPDALALKAAMSILQMQGARARRDMVALQKAKEAALQEPRAFVSDLASGKVTTGLSGAGTGLGADESSSEDEDDGGDDDDARDGAAQLEPHTRPDAMDVDSAPRPEPRPWSNLPSAQDVYRCPPINWGQYAVVGESLDKIHKEQLARPTQGTPAKMLPDGTYEPGGPGKREELVGLAAPYNPFKDKVDRKKAKGSGRQG